MITDIDTLIHQRHHISKVNSRKRKYIQAIQAEAAEFERMAQERRAFAHKMQNEITADTEQFHKLGDQLQKLTGHHRVRT